MKKQVLIGTVAALFAAASVFAGGQKAASGVTFTVAIADDITSLDPAFSFDPINMMVEHQVIEKLLDYNDKDEIVPRIAEGWKEVDSTTYVYTIRQDVTFSDGTPLSMEDVVFSVTRIGDPEVEAYMSYFYDTVDTISQTGDWEITVKLKEPTVWWPHVFATTGGVVSKKYYDAHAASFGSASGGVLGTGPYVLDSWTSGQEIVLKKNANYWDKSVTAQVEKIVFKVIPDGTTLVAALKRGDVDFSRSLPQDQLPLVRSLKGVTLYEHAGYGVVFFAFNTQRAPFNDANVRKAVYHAIDFDAIQKNIVKDEAAPGTVLAQSDSLYGTRPEDWKNYLAKAPSYGYDLAKAKEYLARTQVASGFSFTVYNNGNSTRAAVLEAIQKNLEALNITMSIVELSDDEHTGYQFGSNLDANGKRDFDAIIAGWWADFPDIAQNMEPLFVAGSETNTADYQSEEVTALLKQQATLSDEAERNKLLFQALDIISADVPYIFVMYPSQQVVISDKWTGVSVDTYLTEANVNFALLRKK